MRVELLNLLLPRDRRTYLCFHWWCKRILDGDYQDFGFCSFAACRFFLFSIFLDLRKIRNHATKCNATGTSSDRYRTHFHDGIHFSFAPCLHRACRLPFTIFWCSRWSEGGEISLNSRMNFLPSASLRLRAFPYPWRRRVVGWNIDFCDNIKADVSRYEKSVSRNFSRSCENFYFAKHYAMPSQASFHLTSDAAPCDSN